MYKSPFFISPSAGTFDLRGKTGRQLMLDVGLNTGNMLFAQAAQAVLGPVIGVRAGRAGDLVGLSGSDVDCVVVSAANWLQPRTDLSELADVLERANLPVIVLGLGAQSGRDHKPPELTEGTQKFLSVVAERSSLISVRGQFTAETLAEYGVHNVEVTGCPSLLMMSPAPPALHKSDGPLEKISICGSRGAPNEKTLTSKSPTHVLSRLFAQEFVKNDFDFVAQAEIPEIYMIIENISQGTEISSDWLNFLERYYGVSCAQLRALVLERMKVFFDLPSWVSYLKGRDFVVGTRLHGIIAGLLAGTPSLLIVHDSRTKEMADVMMIPSINASEIENFCFVDGSLDYEALYNTIDYSNFNLRYPIYYRRFREFFNKNGLSHRLRDDI